MNMNSDEVSQVELAGLVVNRGLEIVSPQLMGSDVSDLYKKLKAWADGIDFGALGKVGAKIVLNFVLDEVVPRVVQATPIYLDLIILQVIVPLIKNLLAKLDEPA
jgi:hypothetical protein